MKMSYTSAVITERISWYSCNCLSIADGWYLDCWTVHWYWRKIQFKNDFVFTGCKRAHIQTYTTAVIPFAWIEMNFLLICLCFDLAKIFICNLDTCFIASSVIKNIYIKIEETNFNWTPVLNDYFFQVTVIWNSQYLHKSSSHRVLLSLSNWFQNNLCISMYYYCKFVQYHTNFNSYRQSQQQDNYIILSSGWI